MIKLWNYLIESLLVITIIALAAHLLLPVKYHWLNECQLTNIKLILFGYVLGFTITKIIYTLREWSE